MREYGGDIHYTCLEAEALAKKLHRFKVFFTALYSHCLATLAFILDQLCPTQMAYWAKNYVTVLTGAAHGMAYFDLSKLNLG